MLFTPGKRTYVLSIAAMAMGLLLQGDAQDYFTLAPMLKAAFAMALTVIVPMIPIYLRKALPKDYR